MAGSAVDLTRIMTALDGSRVSGFLSTDSKAQMLNDPHLPHTREADEAVGSWWGLGINVGPHPQRYGHGGLMGGSRSLLVHTENGYVVAIVANTSPLDTKDSLQRSLRRPTHLLRADFRAPRRICIRNIRPRLCPHAIPEGSRPFQPLRQLRPGWLSLPGEPPLHQIPLLDGFATDRLDGRVRGNETPEPGPDSACPARCGGSRGRASGHRESHAERSCRRSRHEQRRPAASLSGERSARRGDGPALRGKLARYFTQGYELILPARAAWHGRC